MQYIHSVGEFLAAIPCPFLRLIVILTLATVPALLAYGLARAGLCFGRWIKRSRGQYDP